MSNQYFVLSHDNARKMAKQAIDQAPESYGVSIKPKSRTLEQNAMLHAQLQRISEQVQWAGTLRTVDQWKRLLTAAWLRAKGEPVEILPAIDGYGVDIVFRKTSELNVKEMIDLIEFIQAWMAEQSIEENV